MDVFQDINWFVVQTKPHRENLAAAYITGLGLPVYLPKVKRDRSVCGKSQVLSEPLFPNYVFAQFRPTSSLHCIRYARGVRRVVSAGGAPLPVSEEIVEALREGEAEGNGEIDIAPFRPNERVEVVDGLFRGFKGLFATELSDRQRVALLLETVEYQARVVVEKRHLKPA